MAERKPEYIDLLETTERPEAYDRSGETLTLEQLGFGLVLTTTWDGGHSWGTCACAAVRFADGTWEVGNTYQGMGPWGRWELGRPGRAEQLSTLEEVEDRIRGEMRSSWEASARDLLILAVRVAFNDADAFAELCAHEDERVNSAALRIGGVVAMDKWQEILKDEGIEVCTVGGLTDA